MFNGCTLHSARVTSPHLFSDIWVWYVDWCTGYERGTSTYRVLQVREKFYHLAIGSLSSAPTVGALRYLQSIVGTVRRYVYGN